MRIARLILSPASDGGSGSIAGGSPPSPGAATSGDPLPTSAGSPTPIPPAPPAPAAPPAPRAPAPVPPAAAVVAGDGPTEFTSDLSRQLEEETKKRIERERRIAELEDENDQLKRVVPKAPAKRDPWTFFG